MTNEELKLEELWDYISSMVGFDKHGLEVQDGIRKFVELKIKEAIKQNEQKTNT
jgi:hypothetical protein